jgi:hypothetical protein
MGLARMSAMANDATMPALLEAVSPITGLSRPGVLASKAGQQAEAVLIRQVQIQCQGIEEGLRRGILRLRAGGDAR